MRRCVADVGRLGRTVKTVVFHIDADPDDANRVVRPRLDRRFGVLRIRIPEERGIVVKLRVPVDGGDAPVSKGQRIVLAPGREERSCRPLACGVESVCHGPAARTDNRLVHPAVRASRPTLHEAQGLQLGDLAADRRIVPAREVGQFRDILAKEGAPEAEIEVYQSVRAAVEALPADFRAVIVLREMDGLSYKEIAEVTGVPIGTVMSRLARARQHLSTLLAEKKELGQL